MAGGFTAVTPTGTVVTCSEERWAAVAAKHPVLTGRAEAVRDTVEAPIEIRRSRHDPAVWLYYRGDSTRLLCAVIQSELGVLITAYPADAVKQGDVVWKPSE